MRRRRGVVIFKPFMHAESFGSVFMSIVVVESAASLLWIPIVIAIILLIVIIILLICIFIRRNKGDSYSGMNMMYICNDIFILLVRNIQSQSMGGRGSSIKAVPAIQSN